MTRLRALPFAVLLWCCLGPAFLRSQQQGPILLTDLRTQLVLPWRPVSAEPAWVAAPPREPDAFHFATVRRGSDGGIAMVRAVDLAAEDAREVLLDQVGPVLGVDAAGPVVAELLQHTVLADAAHEPTRRVPGARGPGQAIGAAYLLWRVPVRAAVAALDPALQGRVEWALLRPVVRWQDIDEPPAWATSPPPAEGQFRIVLQHDAQHLREASQLALRRARAECAAMLVRRLEPVTGKALAERAAADAMSRLAPVHRVWWLRRVEPADERRSVRVTTAFVLWEVPLGAIVRGLPEALHERAVAALGAAGR